MKKSLTKKYDVIVIGGGASGIMAAGVAAARGRAVLLLEKNPVLGKKLALTGGSRCNIAHATYDPHTFLEKFPEAKKFLYSPFSKFAVDESVHFFQETLSLPLTTQAKNRMFPASEKASDVVKALREYAVRSGVSIMTGQAVTDIQAQGNEVTCVTTNDGTFTAEKFILATGGLAAPETGSTGDGFTFLKALGHTVKDPDPNIVPLTTDATDLHACSGTTLEDVRITFKQGDKVKIRERGNILLTHFGISGPLILNAAFAVNNLLQVSPVHARIDLFPDDDEKSLDEKVRFLLESNPKKRLSNILPNIVPRSVANVLLTKITAQDIVATDITREKRKELLTLLKNVTFEITGSLGFEKAVIADGGVIPEEVDFTNMSSRLYPNLYLIGDTLSINRPTGGYSLQLCWTTAWIAGSEC